MNNKITVYTVYMYNIENNDIVNMYESTKREEVAEWLKVGVNNLARHTTENAEELPTLKNDKYFIYKEKIDIEEYYI